MYIFLTIIAIVVAFWGSGRDATGTRIMLLGMVTLYERRRHPALPPPGVITFRFGSVAPVFPSEGAVEAIEEEDEPEAVDADDDIKEDDEEDEVEEEEADERDLWERLADAGFETIDEERSLEPDDAGRIDWERSDYSCDQCEDDLFELWEVFKAPSDHPALSGLVLRNPIGHVCRSCGDYAEFKDDPPKEIGRVWPLLVDDANFFDILGHFETLRNAPPAEPPIPGSEAYPNR